VTHLSAAELQAWYREGRADDRTAVIAHLAQCDTCRHALAVLAMNEERQLSSAPVVTVAEARPLGYAAGPEPRRAGGVPGWLHHPVVRLAGAAAVVMLVFWATTPTVNQRRAIPTMVAGDSPGNADEFRWESPFVAARYRVTLRDTKGVLVFSGETSAAPFRPSAEQKSPLSAGEPYTWKVEAFDASGSLIAESAPVTFVFRP